MTKSKRLRNQKEMFWTAPPAGKEIVCPGSEYPNTLRETETNEVLFRDGAPYAAGTFLSMSLPPVISPKFQFTPLALSYIFPHELGHKLCHDYLTGGNAQIVLAGDNGGIISGRQHILQPIDMVLNGTITPVIGETNGVTGYLYYGPGDPYFKAIGSLDHIIFGELPRTVAVGPFSSMDQMAVFGGASGYVPMGYLGTNGYIAALPAEKFAIYMAGPLANLGVAGLMFLAARSMRSRWKMVPAVLGMISSFGTYAGAGYSILGITDPRNDFSSAAKILTEMTHLPFMDVLLPVAWMAGSLGLLLAGICSCLAPVAVDRDRFGHDISSLVENFGELDRNSRLTILERRALSKENRVGLGMDKTFTTILENSTNLADIVLHEDGTYDMADTNLLGVVSTRKIGMERLAGYGNLSKYVRSGGERFDIRGFASDNYMQILNSKDEKWWEEHLKGIRRFGVELDRLSEQLQIGLGDAAKMVSMFSEGYGMDEICLSLGIGRYARNMLDRDEAHAGTTKRAHHIRFHNKIVQPLHTA